MQNMFEEFRKERERLEKNVFELQRERQSCTVRSFQSLQPPGSPKETNNLISALIDRSQRQRRSYTSERKECSEAPGKDDAISSNSSSLSPIDVDIETHTVAEKTPIVTSMANFQADLSISEAPSHLVVLAKEKAGRKWTREADNVDILPAVCTSLIRTVHSRPVTPVIQASTPPYRPIASKAHAFRSPAQAEPAMVLKDMEKTPVTKEKETMTHITSTKSVGVQVTTRDFSVLSHVPGDTFKTSKPHKNKVSKLTVSDFVYPLPKRPAIEYQPGPISSLIHPAYSSSVLQTYAEIYRDLSKASKAVLSG